MQEGQAKCEWHLTVWWGCILRLSLGGLRRAAVLQYVLGGRLEG